MLLSFVVSIIIIMQRFNPCFSKVTPANSPGFSQLVYSLVFIVKMFTTNCTSCYMYKTLLYLTKTLVVETSYIAIITYVDLKP